MSKAKMTPWEWQKPLTVEIATEGGWAKIDQDWEANRDTPGQSELRVAGHLVTNPWRILDATGRLVASNAFDLLMTLEKR